MSNFVHLHNHSDYSLLDGAASIGGYMKKAKEVGMTSLALTDHGNMFGAVAFYNACRENGINPIVGCEFYIAPGDRHDMTPSADDKYYHLILLAMNDKGYHNLIKLNSIAWSEGYYYRPRIDKETLTKYSDNLICLSACMAGELSRLIIKGRSFGDVGTGLRDAKEAAKWYKNLFGDRYYIEIQNHGILEEKIAREGLVKIARELDIPLVATNDIHYIEKDDSNAHDTLLCIGTGKKKSDTARLKYEDGEYYFRTPEEMAKLFKEYPDAIENTAKIAERCQLEIVFPGPILPKMEIPAPYKDDAEYLTALSYEGLKKRYPNAEGEELEMLHSRLQHELDVITKMGFPSYFLIVRDYIHWAKTHDVPVGPGRGSGAGSLVAYSTEITDVDPIKYSLLFERFLNPERVSLPDFDVDFCFEGRPRVIEYVTEKYGSDSVGQISTFGTLKPKQVVKDVARVLDIPFDEANKISTLIPDVIPDVKHMKLQDAIDREPKLREWEAKGGRYAELFETARKLEGLARHNSLHAAGVVIGRERLDEYVPLCTDQKTHSLATQYTMNELERCGLVKMDFLGLKTLTLIKHTIELIRKKKDPTFDISKIPEDDEATFRMIQDGDTALVFQFESQGMQKHLKRLHPESIEELVAMNALYRPGPMQFIDQYIDSKLGKMKIQYPDPSLERILKPTYGVIVYQEQVMQVAQIIAGYSLGAADNLRRIMSKKKAEQLASELVKFTQGAEKRGHTKKHAEEIFEHLKPFAGYGFNKSHAVAYSIIAYQTAYLKANYIREFLAANLTNEMGNPDKFKEYLQLAPRYGIKIVPPDINRSDVYFSVDGNDVVYGLAGIKNVGEGAVKAIVAGREKNGKYTSLYDFISRQEENTINSRLVESLIAAGALDSIDKNRSRLLANVEDAIRFDKNDKNRFAFGQGNLFGDDSDSKIEFEMRDVAERPISELLKDEKEVLGFYVSGHPLDEFKKEIESSVRVNLRDLSSIPKNSPTQIIAMITSMKVTLTKKKAEKMGIFTIQTQDGEVEAVAFPKTFLKIEDRVTADGIYGFKGCFQSREDGSVNFIIDDVVSPKELSPIAVAKIIIYLSPSSDEEELSILFEKLKASKGGIPYSLRMRGESHELNVSMTDGVSFSIGLSEELKALPMVERLIVG